VRWQLLFDDLEAQLATARAAQAREAVADLVRAEAATTHLADRLRASLGGTLRLDLGPLAGEPEAMVDGRLTDVGEGWLLLGEPAGRQTLVALAAVQAVTGLAPHVAPDEGRVRRGLGLPHAVRALARDRTEVQLSTRGRTLVGRIGRVGADYLEVTGSAGAVWTVPLDRVVVVRSA